MAARIRTDGFVDPCVPTLSAKPPFGPDWVHEIKHDGYRLIVRRDGKAVRLSTRRGHDWTDRYPSIAGGGAILRAQSWGAVVCGANGVAMFDALHRCGVSPTPSYRPSTYWSLMGRLSAAAAQQAKGSPGTAPGPRAGRARATDGRGELVFRQACAMGLEGIVSKRDSCFAFASACRLAM